MNSNTERGDRSTSSEFQENIAMLRQISIFSPLPLDSLKVFAYLCNRGTFRRGEFLFRREEDDGQAFYVIFGRAGLIHEGEQGAQALSDYQAGDFVGGLALLGKAPRLFSLRAETDLTCLIMTREKFGKALEQFPEIVPKIFNAMADRIYRWEKKFLVEHAGGCSECIKKLGVTLL